MGSDLFRLSVSFICLLLLITSRHQKSDNEPFNEPVENYPLNMTNVSFEWRIRPGPGTVLKGGAATISIGSGTASTGKVFTTPWTPGDDVVGAPGAKPVIIQLIGTDSNGTQNILEVPISIGFPPA